MRMTTSDRCNAVLDCAFDRVVSDLFRQNPVEEGKPSFGKLGHMHRRRPEFNPKTMHPLDISEEPMVSGHDLVEVVSVQDEQPISDLEVPSKIDLARFLHLVRVVVITTQPDHISFVRLVSDEI